jgi:hypothetical protein
MTLIRVPQADHRLREFDDRGRFADAMRQSKARHCRVLIQGSEDGQRWFDLEEFWSGEWGPDVPTPTRNDVAAVAAASHVRYGRYVVRSII